VVWEDWLHESADVRADPVALVSTVGVNEPGRGPARARWSQRARHLYSGTTQRNERHADYVGLLCNAYST
jgi:hypothetical protein